MYVLRYLLSPVLLIIIAFIVTMVVLISRQRNHGITTAVDLEKQEELHNNRLSQLYFLFASSFLCLGLYSINLNFGLGISYLWVVLIYSIILVALAYTFRGSLLLIGGWLALVIWWSLQTNKLLEQGGHYSRLTIYLLISLVLYAITSYTIGSLHELSKNYHHFAKSLKYLGIAGIALFLFAFSTKSGIQSLIDYRVNDASGATPYVTIFMIFLLVIIFGASVINALIKKTILPSEAIILFIIFLASALPLILSNTPNSASSVYKCTGGTRCLDNYYGEDTLSAAEIFLAFIYNILALVSSLGLVIMGYKQKQKDLVNSGIFMLFIFIVIKYFDWFYSFMEKSIFFLSTGIILLVVGWLMEKGRRKIINNLNNPPTP